MPAIEFLSGRKTASDFKTAENYYYQFDPGEFELFPKVNKLLRTTFCNLGLWNLNDQYPDLEQPDDLQDEWALGQVFIRKNGLNIQW